MELPKSDMLNAMRAVDPAPVSSRVGGQDAGENNPAVAMSEGGEGGGGLRVSLMPSEDQQKERPDMRRRITVLVLVLVVETLMAGIGYFVVIRKEGALKSDRAALEQELSHVQEDIKASEADAADMVRFNRQTVAAKALLDSHTYWTTAFALIESLTKPAITYQGFTGDAGSHVITMEATGRTYRDVAEQIVMFRENPLVLSLRTTSASATITTSGEVTGVVFSAVLTLDPKAWEKKDFTSTSVGASPSTDSIQIPAPGSSVVPAPAAPVPESRIPVDPGAEDGATAVTEGPSDAGSGTESPFGGAN